MRLQPVTTYSGYTDVARLLVSQHSIHHLDLPEPPKALAKMYLKVTKAFEAETLPASLV